MQLDKAQMYALNRAAADERRADNARQRFTAIRIELMNAIGMNKNDVRYSWDKDGNVTEESLDIHPVMELVPSSHESDAV